MTDINQCQSAKSWSDLLLINCIDKMDLLIVMRVQLFV